MTAPEIMALALVMAVAAGTVILERQQGRMRRIVKDLERRVAGS
jgi:hypothetical protein